MTTKISKTTARKTTSRKKQMTTATAQALTVNTVSLKEAEEKFQLNPTNVRQWNNYEMTLQFSEDDEGDARLLIGSEESAVQNLVNNIFLVSTDKKKKEVKISANLSDEPIQVVPSEVFSEVFANNEAFNLDVPYVITSGNSRFVLLSQIQDTVDYFSTQYSEFAVTVEIAPIAYIIKDDADSNYALTSQITLNSGVPLTSWQTAKIACKIWENCANPILAAKISKKKDIPVSEVDTASFKKEDYRTLTTTELRKVRSKWIEEIHLSPSDATRFLQVWLAEDVFVRLLEENHTDNVRAVSTLVIGFKTLSKLNKGDLIAELQTPEKFCTAALKFANAQNKTLSRNTADAFVQSIESRLSHLNSKLASSENSAESQSENAEGTTSSSGKKSAQQIDWESQGEAERKASIANALSKLINVVDNFDVTTLNVNEIDHTVLLKMANLQKSLQDLVLSFPTHQMEGDKEPLDVSQLSMAKYQET